MLSAYRATVVADVDDDYVCPVRSVVADGSCWSRLPLPFLQWLDFASDPFAVHEHRPARFACSNAPSSQRFRSQIFYKNR